MCLMTIFEGTWSNNGIATALTRAMGLFKNSGYQTIRSCGEFSLMRKKCRTWWSSIAVDSMKVHHVQTNPNCPELDQIGRINWQLQLKSEAEHQELSVNYISVSDIIYIIYIYPVSESDTYFTPFIPIIPLGSARHLMSDAAEVKLTGPAMPGAFPVICWRFPAVRGCHTLW